MCKWLKNLFTRPEEVIVHPTKRALLFGINNYPGSGDDLRGCVNDVYNLSDRIKLLFPGFTTKIYTDSQVTVANFKNKLKKEISILESGDYLAVHYSGHGTYVTDKDGDEGDGYDEALYLYDGPLVDDDIGDLLEAIPEGAIVVLFFDCCYSGTITKTAKKSKNKFRPMVDQRVEKKVKSRVGVKSTMKWVTFSGSSPEQTSADAYIEGKYNGAFTFYLSRYLKPGITYAQWHHYVTLGLAKGGFEQIPQIEGPFGIVNGLVLTA